MSEYEINVIRLAWSLLHNDKTGIKNFTNRLTKQDKKKIMLSYLSATYVDMPFPTNRDDLKRVIGYALMDIANTGERDK